LDHGAILAELQALGLSEASRKAKVIEFRRGSLTIYVKQNVKRQPLVTHPGFEALYSALAGLPGVLREGDLFYHNANLSGFPKRVHGGELIHYGIAFGFVTCAALRSFVDTSEKALVLSAPATLGRTLGDDLVEPETEPTLLAKARIGQGRFRADLLDQWKGCCPLTGVSTPELLRASHIKPWSDSSDEERLDRFNGLLLAVHLDALFDRALISFDETGEMLVSDKLTARERDVFGLFPPLPRLALYARHLAYTGHHRERHRASVAPSPPQA
jgi:hypothetical protein